MTSFTLAVNEQTPIITNMKLATVVKISFALSIVFTVIASFMKITHKAGAEYLFIIGLMAIVAFMVAAIYEVRTSIRINNTEKWLWTIGFIFCTGLTGILYILVARKRIATNY
jgi:hypothetical protein